MVKIYVFKLPKKLGKIVRTILGLFSRGSEE